MKRDNKKEVMNALIMVFQLFMACLVVLLRCPASGRQYALFSDLGFIIN